MQEFSPKTVSCLEQYDEILPIYAESQMACDSFKCLRRHALKPSLPHGLLRSGIECVHLQLIKRILSRAGQNNRPRRAWLVQIAVAVSTRGSFNALFKSVLRSLVNVAQAFSFLLRLAFLFCRVEDAIPL